MNKNFSNILRLEEALLLSLSIYWFYLLNISWWWFVGLILVPDIGMIGYIVNTKVGATTYNLFHNRIVALLILFAGIYLGLVYLKLIGIILFAHVAMDRMLNFGLKYSDNFKHTHLGNINI